VFSYAIVFVVCWFFEGVFDGRPADYLFLLIFNWICLVVSLLSISDLFVRAVDNISTFRRCWLDDRKIICFVAPEVLKDDMQRFFYQID